MTVSDFLLSTGAITLAEIGDKTQLLTLALAARYRHPMAIFIGLLLATLLNHALAGVVGYTLGSFLDPAVLQWVLAISFLAMAGWVLVPDKNTATGDSSSRYGVILATFVTFFIAEMGDKTQVATMALAANGHFVVSVILGTTLGMLLANAPVIVFGDRMLKHVPMQHIRRATAALFAILGMAALISVVKEYL